MKSRSPWLGPLLVGVAAILWATDTLFRLPTLSQIDPIVIVTLEHLIAVIVLSPWIFWKVGKRALALSLREWTAAFLIGSGASAVATVLFTASFRYINPSVTILLQKLQPIIVVTIAYLFLGETPKPRFWFWALLALAAGVVLSFPDFNFTFFDEGIHLRQKGVLFALTAAALWGLSTVAGKALLKKQPVSITTYWRFFFGLVTLGVLIAAAGIHISWEPLAEPKNLTAISYMGLIPGLLAMLAYYKGLSSTRASVATFAELLFPVSAVILNAWILNLPLNSVQIAAGCVLIFAVTQISKK